VSAVHGQGITNRTQACLHEQQCNGGRVQDITHWCELLQAFQGAYLNTPVEDVGEQHAVLSFLKELPRVCPSHGSQAAALMSLLLAQDSWAASARSLGRESLQAPMAQEDLVEVEGDDSARRVENMIAGILGGHPDADVLVPLALLEVATEDEHRRALEARVAEPLHFRHYLLGMVSAAGADVPVERGEMRPAVADGVPYAEVRSAYLQLAKEYHPDKGGDKDMFITLQAAYELLRADQAGTKD